VVTDRRFPARLIMSFLASPDPQRNEQELRDFLRRRFVPALGL